MNHCAPTLPIPRYLVAPEWGPLHLGDEDTTVRWTLDLVTKQLVAAQAMRLDGSSPWAPLSPLERSNLVDSIRRNEVVSNAASFDVRASETLPDWSASVTVPPSTPQTTGDAVRTPARRHRYSRGHAA